MGGQRGLGEGIESIDWGKQVSKGTEMGLRMEHVGELKEPGLRYFTLSDRKPWESRHTAFSPMILYNLKKHNENSVLGRSNYRKSLGSLSLGTEKMKTGVKADYVTLVTPHYL